jgi:Amt family ammonium transporter
MTTNTAAAAGAVAWLLVSWWQGRPASIGMITGAVAGLVAITPAAGYVSVPVSVLIGGVAGVLCYGAMVWRLRRSYD